MKGQRFILKAVRRTSRRGVDPKLAFADTLQADGRVDVQQDGQVGVAAGGGEIIEPGNLRQIQTASVALIGHGGAGEAIGDDYASGGQLRRDDAVHQLGARRREQQQLRRRRQRVSSNQIGAQVIAQPGVARLVQQQGTIACGGQGVVQTARLVGFSGALAALKSYEYPGHIVAPNGGEFGGEG